MSTNSSKRSKKLSSRPMVARAARIIGFPLWVAVSFILAQELIFLTIWCLRKLSILPVLDSHDPVVVTMLALLTYAVTLGIVTGLPFLVRRSVTSWKRIGLTGLPTWVDIALAFAGACVYLFLTSVLLAVAINLFPAINPTEVQDVGFRSISTPVQYLLAFGTLIVLAPLAEEVLFRGYLYGNVRRYVPAWLSILMTSALFGLAHMQWNVGIDTFALSIVLCTLREVTGSIWAGILLHMLKNAVAFYVLFIAPSGLLH